MPARATGTSRRRRRGRRSFWKMHDRILTSIRARRVSPVRSVSHGELIAQYKKLIVSSANSTVSSAESRGEASNDNLEMMCVSLDEAFVFSSFFKPESSRVAARKKFLTADCFRNIADEYCILRSSAFHRDRASRTERGPLTRSKPHRRGRFSRESSRRDGPIK